MSNQWAQAFGDRVRKAREAKQITLRKFAEIIGISPTYLSKVERGDFDPPGEEKIKKIADALGEDPDELLALAGKVSSDLPDIVRKHPREMAAFLRTARNLSAGEIERLEASVRKKQKAPSK